MSEKLQAPLPLSRRAEAPLPASLPERRGIEPRRENAAGSKDEKPRPPGSAPPLAETRRTLADYSENGHANNFHLIRLLAAMVVIFSHSFALTGVAEPTVGRTGMLITGVALDFFFLTSGFLVTRSLLMRRDLVDFVAARVLRIYPGLVVMVLLTLAVAALCLGPAFLVEPRTVRCALSTMLLSVKKLAVFDLPGVFESNPFPRAVNGSLWTLPYELRMYVALAVFWCLCGLRRASRPALMAGAVVAVAGLAAVAKVVAPESINAGFAFMFFAGATFHVMRHRIPLRPGLAWTAAAAIVVSAFFPAAFVWVYPVLIGYVLFSLSYLPRFWRPASDYSYGAYIYAFPVQQTIVSLLPSVTALAMTAIAVPIVMLAAAGSWHFVEKPAMRWKNRLFRRRAGLAPN